MPEPSDPYGIRRLQETILGIAVFLDGLCSQAGITYYLMGGTALGAVRHQGFIPWDDDFDVFMTPGEYAKFKVALQRHPGAGAYHLQEWGRSPDGLIRLAKLRLNGTTYVEPALSGWRIHSGVYVDIFLLHAANPTAVGRWFQFACSRYVLLAGLAQRTHDRRTAPRRVAMAVLGRLPLSLLLPYALRHAYGSRASATSTYVCNYLGKAGLRRGTYLARWFAAGRRVRFESAEFVAPAHLRSFLRARFGDYAALPPPSARRAAQHASTWDTSRDFRSYQPENGLEDEFRLV